MDCVTGRATHRRATPTSRRCSHAINRNRRSTSNITLSGGLGRFGRATTRRGPGLFRSASARCLEVGGGRLRVGDRQGSDDPASLPSIDAEGKGIGTALTWEDSVTSIVSIASVVGHGEPISLEMTSGAGRPRTAGRR